MSALLIRSQAHITNQVTAKIHIVGSSAIAPYGCGRAIFFTVPAHERLRPYAETGRPLRPSGFGVRGALETRREWDTPWNHSHAYRNRPQPQLPALAVPPREGRREGAREDLGLPHRPARGEGRRSSPGAQGPETDPPRSRLHHRTPGPPNGHIRPLPARRPKCPRARPGRGDGRETRGGTDIEARNDPAAAYHDIGRKARPGRCRRGHAVPGNGPAACAGRRAGVRRCGGEPP